MELLKNVLNTGETFLIDEMNLGENYGGIYVRLRAFKMDDVLGIMCKNITEEVEIIDALEVLMRKVANYFREPLVTILGLTALSGKENDADQKTT